MSNIGGTWVDQNKAEITINQNESIVTVKYGNGRGPFSGYVSQIGNNTVVTVNFSDGHNPDTGVITGVLNFADSTIFWGNSTHWNRSLK